MSEPLFSVENAQKGDLDALTTHFAAVADEPLFVLTLDFPRTRDNVEKFLNQVLQSSYAGLVVAKQKRAIIGHCLVRSTDHPALRHVAKVSMAVSADARRQGVGQAL